LYGPQFLVLTVQSFRRVNDSHEQDVAVAPLWRDAHMPSLNASGSESEDKLTCSLKVGG
jgi:hypothetical protein